MLTTVDPQFRIQWDIFTNKDEFGSNFKINVGAMIVTTKMVEIMVSNLQWNGVAKINAAGVYEIGYGIGDPTTPQGMTEQEAYSAWFSYIKTKQKALISQLPVITLPQSVFDAVLSLYVSTGKWRTVEASEGTYNLSGAIQDANWKLVGDMISRGQLDTNMRRTEARVAVLADYSLVGSRQQNIISGIHQIRTEYFNGSLTDFEKLQSEFVYYKQVGIFLSGMSDLRKRRILTQI
jgi:hypothetical protein